MRNFQKDAESKALENLAEKLKSTNTASSTTKKSTVSPTGGEPDPKRAKTVPKKGRERKPAKVGDDLWKRYSDLKSSYKLTYRKKLCYDKILKGECAHENCRFSHMCPSCNNKQTKEKGHVVFDCPKLTKCQGISK